MASIAQTRSGQVEGEERQGVHVFRGIPYAAPPVGAKRWRAPDKVEAWSGVRKAVEFGAAAPQNKVALEALEAFVIREAQNEDCLFLNVWTPGLDGARRRVYVHRKGATRALGPGHPALAPHLRPTGQPVIIPGDMGRYSFVLVGTERAMAETFGTTCHGAGRTMSRAQAKKAGRGLDLTAELARRGVVVRAKSLGGVAEEMPWAYKDVADVVDVVHAAGIARKVARLRPLAVVKG